MTRLKDRRAAGTASPSTADPLPTLKLDASSLIAPDSATISAPPQPYAVRITGLETLSGFTAFANCLDPSERALPFGRRLGQQEEIADAVVELAADVGDMVAERIDRLGDPQARADLLAFPTELCTVLINAARRLSSNPAPQAILLSGTFDGHPVFATTPPTLIANAGTTTHPKPSREPVPRLAAYAIAGMVTLALFAALALAFVSNRSLTAEFAGLGAQEAIARDPHLAATSIADTDLANVVDVLSRLSDIRAIDGGGSLGARLGEWLSFDQGRKLQDAAAQAYAEALQRQFRSRLSLQIEQVIQARIGEPAELYEPLKIYLTLTGQAPHPDAELIVAWFRRDWEQVRYPGAANRPGRTALEAHLRALLALPQPTDPALVDRGLIEASQRSLSRMDLASFADALIRAGSYSAELEDFTVSTVGGPQAATLFGTASGRGIASLRIPGLYTASGFHQFFLPQLSKVAQQIIDDQWVMGAGGQQVGVEDQLRRLGPAILDRYGQEFTSAWNGMLEELRLKPLSDDGPNHDMLAILASVSSPLMHLVEAIGAETRLSDYASAGEPANLSDGLSKVGIIMPGSKSQARAGGAFTSGGAMPGASIEAQFGGFQRLTEGPAGRRPIDALVRNLRDIHQSLALAGADGGSERAAANLQLQVLNLRSNASRLPRQLARMIQAAADDFEGDVATTTLAQLNRQFESSIAGPCRTLVDGAYPFTRNSDRDASVGEFAQLFAPGGEFDRFFAQSLAPLVEVTGTSWKWRPDSRIARDLSQGALIAFQRAADIRDAFFPERGSLAVTLKPFSLHADADMALLDIDGQVIQSFQSGSSPATVNWPGSGDSERVDLSLTPAIPGRVSNLHVEGEWALMRLFDNATITMADAGAQARFVVGGRDVAYTLQFNSKQNPFDLAALKEFRCPDKL